VRPLAVIAGIPASYGNAARQGEGKMGR
jgi:hypothetical protein